MTRISAYLHSAQSNYYVLSNSNCYAAHEIKMCTKIAHFIQSALDRKISVELTKRIKFKPKNVVNSVVHCTVGGECKMCKKNRSTNLTFIFLGLQIGIISLWQ